MKICKGCNLEKDLSDFHNCKNGKFGKKPKCKICVSFDSRKYSIENKKEIKERRKEQYELNKEKIIKRVVDYSIVNKEKIKVYQEKYRLDNRKKLNEYYVKRNKTDDVFYLKSRIRKSLNTSVKKNGFVKYLRTEDILGCDFLFFKEYIEAQFKKGMTWENIHIDHIKPLSIAKTQEKVIELNHYTNLQPLFCLDNLLKSNKVLEKQLRLL